MRFLAAIIAMTVLPGCASTPVTIQTRNVLIVGFLDGELRPDEVAPVLTEVEMGLGQQQTGGLRLRIRQKVVREVIWPNDLAQTQAVKEGVDDIYLVGISIHPKIYSKDGMGVLGQTGVETKGILRITYVNAQMGTSQVLASGEAMDTSIYGGETGVARTKPNVLASLRRSTRSAQVVALQSEPQLMVTNPTSRSTRGNRIQVIVTAAREENVPKIVSLALPGVIMSSLSSTGRFVAVSRGERLDSAMREIATTRSFAFDQSKVVKVGQMTGAKLMLAPEVFCEDSRCVLNFGLFDLTTGENIRTISKDSEPQLASVKQAIEEMVKEFQATYDENQGGEK